MSAEQSIQLSGDEHFYTLQGEGDSIGKPATFLRLHFCNLECSWCDTKYTWDGTEKPIRWDIDKVVEEIAKNPTHRVVITGGEPLIQQKPLVELVEKLSSTNFKFFGRVLSYAIPKESLRNNWDIEIETNGTIAPIPELEGCQFNVSPKLANSDNPLEKRYKPEVLKHFNKLNSFFKFVVTSAPDIAEIDAIIRECNLDKEKIIIMPEGVTQDDIHTHALEVVELVKLRGWRLLPRLQTMLWGKTRKV